MGAKYTFADPSTDPNVKLVEGITGWVVRETDGEPIGRVRIKVTRTDYSFSSTYSGITDPNGFFGIPLTQENEYPVDFYVCFWDNNNTYIPESYGEHYYNPEKLATSDIVTVDANQVVQLDETRLILGGDIQANFNVPLNKMYTVILEGDIFYKGNQQTESWTCNFKNLNNSTLNLKNPLYALPYGDYIVKLEDSDEYKYPVEINDTGDEIGSYNPYVINEYINTFEQYYDQKSNEAEATIVSLSNSNLNASVTFSSLDNTGMIYGILTDPDVGEIRSYTFIMNYVSYHCLQQVENSWWDAAKVIEVGDGFKRVEELGLSVDKNCMNEGIDYLKMEILPVNNEEIMFESMIPSKLLLDPNNDNKLYYTGKYGGYAFKFLEFGEYKLHLLRQWGDITLLDVYYNGPDSVEYSIENSLSITLDNASPKLRKNLKLQKTTIRGELNLEDNKPLRGVELHLYAKYGDYKREIARINFDPNVVQYPGAEPNEFLFSQLLGGEGVEVLIYVDEEGYSAQTISSIDLGYDRIDMGDDLNFGSIVLQKAVKPTGNKTITGRVVWDQEPEKGLWNIRVKAKDINYSDEYFIWDANTDVNGYYTITGLPDSKFIVYTLTDPNIYFDDSDPNDILFFDEFYDNVTAFHSGAPWSWELGELGYKIPEISTLNLNDPNILVTVVPPDPNTEVNFALSTHRYSVFQGMNLFAYPGEPILFYNTAHRLYSNYFPTKTEGKAGISKIYSLCYRFIDHNLSDWKSVYYDPNSGVTEGTDFDVLPNKGYVLYANWNEKLAKTPPFYIVSPAVDLTQGPNLIGLPDVFEKGWDGKDVLSDINDPNSPEMGTCINHYDPRSGKWKSITNLWGEIAGENFPIERHRGYLVHMKNSMEWTRKY